MKKKTLLQIYNDFKKDTKKEFEHRGINNINFELFGSIKTKKRIPEDVDVMIIIPKAITINKFNFLRKVLDEIQYHIKYQNSIHAFLLNGKYNVTDRKVFHASRGHT